MRSSMGLDRTVNTVQNVLLEMVFKCCVALVNP
jgi:hypothetical protein